MMRRRHPYRVYEKLGGCVLLADKTHAFHASKIPQSRRAAISDRLTQ